MIYKNKLYNGEIELVFNEFGHKYNVDGEPVTSVTTVLSVIAKPALINWASGCAVDYIKERIKPGESYDELQLSDILEKAKVAHRQKKEDAGNLGTFLHQWVEKFIKGEDPGVPVNEQLAESVAKFKAWVERHDVKFLKSEQMIYSKRFKYCGTTDFICTVGGKLYIGDLKTSNGIYSEMWIQTSAYRLARSEEFPEEKYAGQLIVRIGKDGSFEFAIMSDNDMYNDMVVTFISALELSKGLAKLEKFKGERE